MAISGNKSIEKNGLVFSLDIADKNCYRSGSSNLFDLSDINSAFTLYNGTSFSSENGGSLVFDGVDDGVSGSSPGPNAYSITGSMSIEAWMFSNGNDYYVLGKGPSNGAANNLPGNYELQLISKGVNFLHQTSTSDAVSVAYYAAPNIFPSNTWNHVVLTCDGTIGVVYVNGSPNSMTKTGTAGSGLVSVNTQPLRIGRRIDGSSYGGNLSVVRIYNRILSQEEVRKNYNSEKSRFDTDVYTTSKLVTNGLVLYMNATDQQSYVSGSTAWYDLSGNKIVGTLTNGVGYTGSNDGAITFDGVNDYVDVINTSSLGITGDISILSWIKLTDYTNYNGIVGKTTSSLAAPFDYYIAPSTDGGNPRRAVLLRGNGSSIPNSVGATSSIDIPTGSWQHVAVTMIGTTVVHYLNGVANSNSSIVTTIGDAGKSLKIGSRDDLFTKMKGNIAVVQIYNRGLSASEILQNYNAQKSTYSI